MWQKVKTVFCIAVAVLGALGLVIASFFVGRSSADGQGSGGNDERDKSIREGLDSSTGRLEEVAGRVESGQSRIRRAGEILSEAVKRGKEKADSSMGSDRSK